MFRSVASALVAGCPQIKLTYSTKSQDGVKPRLLKDGFDPTLCFIRVLLTVAFLMLAEGSKAKRDVRRPHMAIDN